MMMMVVTEMDVLKMILMAMKKVLVGKAVVWIILSFEGGNDEDGDVDDEHFFDV